MPLALNDLRCEVLWRSTKRPGAIRQLLSEPEVGNFHVAVFSEEKVLRFQVPVDDVPGVEILQSGYNFCGVKVSCNTKKCISEIVVISFLFRNIVSKSVKPFKYKNTR